MDPIKVAIQKSGRLSEDSIKLFRECGIKFSNGRGKLKATASNFPIEFLFLRDDDIPGYIQDGVADAGIVGQNVLVESDTDIEEVTSLGFSKCRLSLAISRDIEYPGLDYFQNSSIATSYPKILSAYLSKKNIEAEIHTISGSVEIAPGIGLTDAICDIVSSGSTLLSNSLTEVEVIFHSQAVLVANRQLDKGKSDLLSQLKFRINAVLDGRNNKYVLLNAPNEKIEDIVNILPGMKSPTVMPLASKGWSSVHSVINEDEFWENIEKIRAAGAEGILVVPIEKMIR